MRKILAQKQNNSKALEVRLETEGTDSYKVIIAGITFHMGSACRGGVCEPTGENNYLEVENETYTCQSFTDYQKAKQTYDTYNSLYLD